MSAVYYYEPDLTWQDHVREHASALTIACMDWNFRLLSPFIWLEGLRWSVDALLMNLFEAWEAESRSCLQRVLDGFGPLDAVDDWTRSHFADFDSTEWDCIECDTQCTAGEAAASYGRCPSCYSSMWLINILATHPQIIVERRAA